MSFRGTCPECDKRYKVPDADREWNCKDCDVPLELESLAPESPTACPSCGTDVAPDDSFCEECGAGLKGAAAGKRPDSVSAREKLEAAAAMLLARKRLRIMRAVLILNAVFLGIAFAATLGMDLDLDAGEQRIVQVVYGVLLGLTVVGLFQLRRWPVPVTLTLALIDTLFSVLNFLAGDYGLMAILRLVFMWGSVYHAFRLTALARQFPDFYSARKLRGEHLRHGRGDRELSRKHAGRGRATRDKTALVASGATVVLAGVAAWFVIAPEAPDLPDSPEPGLELFRAAWNAGDVSEMAENGAVASREKFERSFRRALDKYEWGSAFPRADSFSYEDRGDGSLEATLHTLAGEAPLRMEWDGERWVLKSVGFGDIKDWRP